MNWKHRLLTWTQDLYAAIWICEKRKLPAFDCPALRVEIRRCNIKPRTSDAPPLINLRRHKKSVSANIDDAKFSKAIGRFPDNLVRFLVIDLASLLELSLKEICSVPLENETSIEEQLAAFNDGTFSDMVWARSQAIELICVRNCVVHNRALWSKTQINRLTCLLGEETPIPLVDDPIRLEFSHLFAYKAAVRNILNRAAQRFSSTSMGTSPS